jgi:hypothetical protein
MLPLHVCELCVCLVMKCEDVIQHSAAQHLPFIPSPLFPLRIMKSSCTHPLGARCFASPRTSPLHSHGTTPVPCVGLRGFLVREGRWACVGGYGQGSGGSRDDGRGGGGVQEVEGAREGQRRVGWKNMNLERRSEWVRMFVLLRVV